MGITTKKIQKVHFPAKNYNLIRTDKSMIVVHGTGSSGNGNNVAQYFNTLKDKVATCIVINKDGTPVQLFSSSNWAYHLGLRTRMFTSFGLPSKSQLLNKISIGVELINWNYLKEIKEDHKPVLKSWAGTIVHRSDAIYYNTPFRNYHYYDKITPEQILSLKELLIYWHKVYNIPLNYNYNQMFTVNKNALSGKPGLYGHCSFRTDKYDIHPQPDMIEMLEKISMDYK